MSHDTIHTTFISGTFEDIEDLRERVARVLYKERVLPIDLGGLGHRTQEVKPLIDGELDASDFYIAVLGHRYGSRVADDPTGLSWTHYEYQRFFDRETQRSADSAVNMMVLVPKEGSPAYRKCKARAEDVMQRMFLPTTEMERDAESLAYFKKYIGGGRVGLPDPELIDPVHIPSRIARAVASRTNAPAFEDDKDIEIAILRFLDQARVAIRLRSGRNLGLKDGPPVAESDVGLSEPTLARLRPDSLPPALCAVTTRLDNAGLTAREIANAIVQRNLWEDEDERRLDVPGIPDRSVDGILRAMAEIEFDAHGDTRDALIESIAEEVVGDRISRTLCVAGVSETGVAKKLIREVWPALQKAIAAKRDKANPGRLFLILSCELSPGALATHCQPVEGKPVELSKPILLTEKAILPDALLRSAGQRKGTLPE